MKTSGHDKLHVTVMLTARSDGLNADRKRYFSNFKLIIV